MKTPRIIHESGPIRIVLTYADEVRGELPRIYVEQKNGTDAMGNPRWEDLSDLHDSTKAYSARNALIEALLVFVKEDEARKDFRTIEARTQMLLHQKREIRKDFEDYAIKHHDGADRKLLLETVKLLLGTD